MGKSDSIVFNEYKALLSGIEPASVAFLGFSAENDFTRSVVCKIREFYDLSLENWQINSDWSLRQNYDLIVCTRCPYFARHPWDFVDRCHNHLNPGGYLLLDWGLGDHWRFPDYKVGWRRGGEHEFAYCSKYLPDNCLWSCMWRKSFEEEDEVKAFWSNVAGRFGYSKDETLSDVVAREVPALVDYDYDKIKFKFLWPDSPQLYIYNDA